MDTTIPENAALGRNYTLNGVLNIRIFHNGGKTVHDYKGTLETEGIISYLKKYAGPASLEIKSKEDAANLIDGKKIVLVFLFLNFSTDLDAFKSKHYDLTVSYKGKEANFLLGDAETGKRALQYFGLDTDQAPLVFVLSMDDTKYVQRHVQPDNLASWLKDCKDGKLKPYLKSLPIPEVNNAPDKVVVAETLEDMVLNSGKYILVEFYQLGCKYCEEFTLVLDEIALLFEKDPDVLIVKVDGTENDIPRDLFEAQGFPTLYLRSATGSLPRFEGNRTKEAIIEFIQTNRGTPTPSNFVKSDLTVSDMAQKEPVKDEL